MEQACELGPRLRLSRQRLPPGTTYGVTINGGSVSGGAFTVDRLTLGGGVLLANLDVALTADFQGVDNASATIASLHALAGSTTTVGSTPGYTLTITGALTNDGNFVYQGGTLDGSLINNGTLTIAGASLAAGTFPPHLTLANKGLINIVAGTFTMATPLEGATVINAGATLNLRTTQAANASISGAGDVVLNGTVNGSYAVTGTTTTNTVSSAMVNSNASTGNLVVAGPLSGTGTLTVNGFLDWQGDVIGLAGGLIVNANALLGYPVSPQVLSTSLSLASGYTTEYQGELRISPGAVLSNNGTFHVTSGFLFGGGDAPATSPATFINAGTFVVDVSPGRIFSIDSVSGSKPSRVPLSFQNLELVKVLTGNFILAAPEAGTTPGSFDVAQNATLTLSGPLTCVGSSLLTGAGLVTLGNANAQNIGGDVAFNNVQFNGVMQGNGFSFNGEASVATLGARFIRGSGALTLTGTSTLVDPQVSIHELHIAGNVTIQQSGSGPTFDGTTVDVKSGGTLTAIGVIQFLNDAILTNNGLIRSRGFNPEGVDNAHPGGVFTNNGTILGTGSFNAWSTIILNNNGTIIINVGGLLSAPGTDSPTAVISVPSRLPFLLTSAHPLLAGSLLVSGAITASPGANKTVTLGSALTFKLTGSTTVQSGTLLLAAPQDLATTGVFTVNADAALDLAADYSFARGTDPTLAGAGLVIVDPQITLVLAADTAFTGTIRVNGTLIVAPPRDPNAPASSLMRFTILPAAVPEPASVGLLSAGLLPLLRRRPPRAFSRHR